MAKHPLWSDEYWLLLMQLYLRKPAGVKPLYSRQLVELALELHIPPQFLHAQMFRLRQLDTPLIQKLWDTYSRHPKRLQKEVQLLRRMNGFGLADDFYQGVEINESWEKDFKPIGTGSKLTLIKLIMILDLYFRLTPITMVPETPEITELSRLIDTSPTEICAIMTVYQSLDPYLNRTGTPDDRLLGPCKAVWQRYCSDGPENLAAFAAQVKDYFSK